MMLVKTNKIMRGYGNTYDLVTKKMNKKVKKLNIYTQR